jgi:hypothetical protein
VAFKRFYARHPDALLVPAWCNPWPKIADDTWPEVPHVMNNNMEILNLIS